MAAFINLKQFRSLSVIFICLTLFHGATSSAHLKCSELFSLNSAQRPDTGYEIPQRLQDLHPIHLRWLQSAQAQIISKAKSRRWHMEPVGGLLLFNGAKFPIVALLGHGEEAAVYLVATPDGLRSAKVFDNDDGVRIQKYGMNRNKSKVRPPLIIDEGSDGKTLLFEYLEGVPVNQIYSLRHLLGLSDVETAQIHERFRQLSEENYKRTGYYLSSYNVVYSFKFQTFAMIDPR